jgi:hypothetical protein
MYWPCSIANISKMRIIGCDIDLKDGEKIWTGRYVPPREEEGFGINGVLGESGAETILNGGDGGLEGEARAYHVERDCGRHFEV